MGNNFNLAITLLANLYRIAEIANAIVDLDLVVEEFFKGGDIEDLVRGRLGCVDDILYTPKTKKTSQPKKKKPKHFSVLAYCLFDVLVGFCNQAQRHHHHHHLEGVVSEGMDGWGTLGDDNIPSWLFWPVCLPLDHQHQSDWISTFFLKKRIGLHLAYCFFFFFFFFFFFSHTTFKVEAWV